MRSIRNGIQPQLASSAATRRVGNTSGTPARPPPGGGGAPLRPPRQDEPGERRHTFEREGYGVHGDEVLEAAVHARRRPGAAVDAQADAEALDLFVEGPELAPADVAVHH